MNRIVARISISRNIWIVPHVWRNRYTYHIRRSSPPRNEVAFGHRLLFLCFDCELAIIPKNSFWNPDGTHLNQPTD